MKRTIFLSAIVAFLVSALTIGGFYYLNGNDSETHNVTIQKIDGGASNVLYTKDANGDIQPLNFEKVASEVMPAVVSIKSKIERSGQQQQQQYLNPFRRFFQDMPNFHRYYNPQPVIGMGSGVIINKKGYIVTNNHVITDAEKVTVTLHDNREFTAHVVGTDPTTDIALIKIDGAKNLHTLPLVNSNNVKVGEWVLAVGNPFGLTSTVTAGIVSAKARNINIIDSKYAVESFIQTDAAINKGNSGGALVNLQGGLIGINSAIYSPSGAYSGYGFAVPSNIVSKVVEDLLQYGSVQRGFLGVSIANITNDLVKKQSLKVKDGVYVVSVKENSAASEAGIKAGDVITAVNGIQVHSSPKLQELIATKRPGDTVELTINSNGKEKVVKATLYNKKGTTDIVELDYSDAAAQLGIKLRELDSDEAAQLNIDGGVMIEEINAGHIAQETSIREGFIILEVDGQKVSTVEDVNKILGSKHGNYVEIKGIYKDVPGVYYYGINIDN